MKAPALRHGLSRTLEYRAWQQMRLRCLDPKHAAYPNYGGRGITVCERWLESPSAFVADMGRKPSPAHELDRRDNDGPYSPENCRWVLRKVNDRNRRSNRLIDFRGERLALAGWAERFSISADTITKRLASGWSVEDALTTPARAKLRNGERAARGAAAAAAYRASRKLPAGVKAKRARFVARIRVGGNERFLGSFDTPEQAHAAYVAAKTLARTEAAR